MMRVYLDNNANNILDSEVARWMINFLQDNVSSNPSSIHYNGRQARIILEKARLQVARSIGIIPDKDDLYLIFTASGTEANNLVVHNFQDYKLLVSATEHVSILDLDHKDKEIIKVNSDGIIDYEHLTNLLNSSEKKALVSIMLANNETGVINDIYKISEIVHHAGAKFHCDASQAYGKIPLNFKDLGCDLLTISAHKSGGPVGASALIGHKNLALKPQIKGGKQEYGLRAGTENLLAIGGFGVLAEYIDSKIERFSALTELRNFMEEEIFNIAPEAIFVGKQVNRLPNTSCIRMPNVKSEEQIIRFDLAGFSLSSGSACSSGRIATSHVLQAMGFDEKIANEIIRVSLGPDTKKEEIRRFLDLWKEIYIK